MFGNMTSEDSVKWLAKGAIITFVGMIISKVFYLAYRTIIARMLGPSDYGLFSLGLAVLSIVAVIAGLGIEGGVERYIGYYWGKRSYLKGIILSSIKIVIMSSLVWMIILLLSRTLIVPYFTSDPTLKIILLFFALILPLFVILNLLVSFMNGFKTVELVIIVKQIWEPFINLAFTGILLYFGYALMGVVIGYILAIILSFILAFFFVYKRIVPRIRTKEETVPMASKLFSFSIPLVASNILANFVLWIDSLMIAYYITAEQVGIYNVAIPLASIMVMPIVMFQSLFVPVMTKLYAESRIKDIEAVYQIMLRWIIILSLPVFLILFVLGEEIIIFLFGQVYQTGIISLRLLIIGFFIIALFGPIGLLYNIIGKTKYKLIVAIVSLFIAIITNIIFIPLIGTPGAAFATSLTKVINVILLFIPIYYIFKLKIVSFKLLKKIPKIIISAIGSFILVILLFNIISLNISSYNLLLFVLIYLCLYILLLLLLKGFGKEDVMIIKAVLAKVPLNTKFLK
jgi:O-antigen/teichoic acid export membrane protein